MCRAARLTSGGFFDQDDRRVDQDDVFADQGDAVVDQDVAFVDQVDGLVDEDGTLVGRDSAVVDQACSGVDKDDAFVVQDGVCVPSCEPSPPRPFSPMLGEGGEVPCSRPSLACRISSGPRGKAPARGDRW